MDAIAATLHKGEVYVPLLLQDEGGTAHANDWARGFMRGMHMRHDGWAELVNDEDPEMRPEPISPEKREEIVAHMADGLLGAYRYFRSHPQAGASARPSEHRRSTPKVGRNDACPCGSGKKYKKCCGGATVN